MFWVLVLIALSNPADRALYSTDGKTPVVFQTEEACITEGRKQGLKLKAARIPVELQCVTGSTRLDGVIVEGAK